MSETLVVSEVFGPTFQGEGPSIGRRAGFVRLGRCNLDCAWCDTPYTWDWGRHDPEVELRQESTAEVLATLSAMSVDLVVVTGGEPMLQQSGLRGLLEGCRSHGWRVEVETNGTIGPTAEIAGLVDQWNVSPKLANSGVPEHRRVRLEALKALDATGRAVAKIVVTGPDDLEEAAALLTRVGWSSPVWVMPEGTDAEAVRQRTAALAEAVLARGWNLTTRLHVLVWGDRRGV